MLISYCDIQNGHFFEYDQIEWSYIAVRSNCRKRTESITKFLCYRIEAKIVKTTFFAQAYNLVCMSISCECMTFNAMAWLQSLGTRIFQECVCYDQTSHPPHNKDPLYLMAILIIFFQKSCSQLHKFTQNISLNHLDTNLKIAEEIMIVLYYY